MNKFSLNCALKRDGITHELMDIFSNIYELNITDYDELNFIIYELLNKNRKPLNYAKELKDKFNIKQYKILRNYLKTNPKDSMSKEFHKAKYGDDWEIHYAKRIDGIKINLDHFNSKYGEKEGKIKYLEVNAKKAGTLENYIRVYGKDEGTERYKLFCERNKGNHTLKRQIEKHGEELGKQRFEENQYKLKNKNTLEYYIERFGDEEGRKRYLNRNLKNSISTKNNSIWVRDTPAYNEYRKKQEKLGNWISYDDMTEYEIYVSNVWYITNRQDLKSLPYHDKRGHQRDPDTFGLDHIISIKYGFTHGIPYDIIGHINNLQFIPNSENSKKQDKCYSLLKYNKNSIKTYGDIFCI